MSLTTTALFYCLDDFASSFEDWERHRLIPTGRQRHRSPLNAFVHVLSCLAAYMSGKTKIKMKPVAYPLLGFLEG